MRSTATEEEFDLGVPPVDGDPPSARRRRRSGAVPWVVTALVLVVVGAINASPVPLVFGRGDGIAFGVSELDLGSPPDLVWTIAWQDESVMTTTDATLVTVDALDQGGQVYRGRDLDDGAEVWRYQDDDGSCAWQTITCVEEPGWPGAVVVEVDTDDGSQTRTPHPNALSALRTDRGLLVIEAAAEPEPNSIVLLADDGSEQWRTYATVVEAGVSGPVSVWVTGDRIDFALGTSLDLETGEPADLDEGFSYEIDGAVVEELPEGGTVLHTDEGEMRLAVDQLLVFPDDDLGGPVTFHTPDGGGVVARVGDTELWRVDAPDCWPQLRVRGTVLIGCYGSYPISVTAHDEASGEVLWGPVEGEPAQVAGADAMVLAGTDAVTGVDPRSGEVVWSVPLTGGSYTSVIPFPGGLLAYSGSTATRLRW